MKTLKKLLVPHNQSPKELARNYLKTISFQSFGELHLHYQTSMNSSLRKCNQPHQFLSYLLEKILKAPNETTAIKLLTLIHYFIIHHKYNREDIKPLEELDISDFYPKSQEPWFTEFLRSYLTYFVKMYSQSDVYANTLSENYEVNHQEHLTHLFRLTNTVSTLFPHVNNTMTTVGRYQVEKYKSMKELFTILSGELNLVYTYIKYLCTKIFKHYREYNINDLKCFLKSLPDLEALCDKIEDILVNKYMKCRKVSSKMELKEEQIAELEYYLKYEYGTSPKQKENCEFEIKTIE